MSNQAHCSNGHTEKCISMTKKTKHFQLILSDVYSLSERFFIDANNVKQTQLKLGSTSDFTEVRLLTFHTNVGILSKQYLIIIYVSILSMLCSHQDYKQVQQARK